MMVTAMRCLLGLAVVWVVLVVIAGAGASPLTRQAAATWGTHGSVRIPNVRLERLLEDRAGRVVGLGLFDDKKPLGSHATVVRLLSDGRLDTTFGKDGFANAPYRRFLGWTGGAVLGNGNIVVVGTDDYGNGGGDAHVVLSMLDVRGHLNTGFGAGGYLTVSKPCVHDATGLVADQSGFVVVLLQACSFKGAQTPMLTRFTSTGAVVTNFASRGSFALPGMPWRAVPTTPIVRLPDGSLVVASLANGSALVQLTRIRASGTRDPGFGKQRARVDLDPAGVQLTALFVARLGRFTVTGCSSAGPFQIRFNRDGSPYRFWGGSGLSRTNVENFGGAFGAPCASFVQLQSYKLAVAGTALLRLYPSGRLDPFQPLAPLPAFAPSAQDPAHVLLALSEGAVIVTSQLGRDSVVGRYW
jgi:hypothetical protein